MSPAVPSDPRTTRQGSVSSVVSEAASRAVSKIESFASAAVDPERSGAEPPPPAPPKTAAAVEPQVQGGDASWGRTIREVVDQVEAVRGLRRKTPLKVAIVGDAEFTRVLRAKAEAELTPRAVAMERARWAAFGLAPPTADPRQVLLSVLDEQAAGFYDPASKSLTVRAEPPASAGGPEMVRLVLAHEIEHALQDQNFGFPDFKALADDDARLARMAVYEGDAMATMIAFAARSAGQPVRLALSAAASAAQSTSAEQMLAQSGLSPELLKAPAIVREEMLLPYREGLALIAEVHRRGGWELVDRMFQRPPLTTHQVLHPEAYLAGESPAEVPYPRGPEGMQVIATGRMGELGTRVALTGCVDAQVAADFARAWAGDAYTIVRAQGDSIALVWSTVWSADAPKTFANLIGMQAPCWSDAAASTKGGWRISAESEVAMNGAKAALARGFGQLAVRTAAASAVAFAARIPPPAPPLGSVAEPAAAAKGRVTDGRFVDPRLSLEAQVPSGFSADLEQSEAELLLRNPRPPAVAALSFVPEPATPETIDGFFQSAAASFATRIGGSTLKLRAATKTTLLGKAAQERSWDVDGTFAVVRITLAPACQGRAFYAVLRAAASAEADKALERFVGSLRQSAPGTSPACAELE
jgi:hypothetical protein